MPNWKRLAEEGYTARLSSDYPLISPMLWTTAATGVPPDVHRVLDFQEVDPASGRKVPDLGPLAARAGRLEPGLGGGSKGRRRRLVGDASGRGGRRLLRHPTARARSSSRTFRARAWPFPAASRPASRRSPRATAASPPRTSRPTSVSPSPQIAAALSSGAGMENPVVGLGRVLGATRVTQRIARDLYDRTRPDLAVVYFGGTDEVGHLFASFTPPRLACASVTDGDVAKYGRVVDAYYAAIDRILGPVDAPSGRGRRGSPRPFGSRLQVGKRPPLRPRLRRLVDGGVLAPPGGSARDLGTRRAARAAAWKRAPRRRGAHRCSPCWMCPGSARMTGRPVAAAFELRSGFSRSGTAPPEVRRVADAPMTEAESSEYAKKLLALGYLSPGRDLGLAPAGGDAARHDRGRLEQPGRVGADDAKESPGRRSRVPGVASPQSRVLLSDVQPRRALPRTRGHASPPRTGSSAHSRRCRSDPSIAVVSLGARLRESRASPPRRRRSSPGRRRRSRTTKAIARERRPVSPREQGLPRARSARSPASKARPTRRRL